MNNAMQELPVIIRDSREKQDYGFNFRKSKNCAGMIVQKLDFGDYAIQGHENLIVIERKQSVTELCGNLGKNRERFIRELERMNAAECKFKYVIIEDYYSSIDKQKYTRMRPNAIFQSIMSFEIKYGVHFVFAGGHARAHEITRSLLLWAHRYKMNGTI